MVKSAIILAGGKGERLRPYTDKLPKPMVPVLGRPIVEYQVLWLKNQGIKHIVFACSYMHEEIENFFKDGSKYGMKFDYSIEDEPLGRGGAFKKALGFIPKEEGLILGANGDEITVEPLEPWIEFHKKNNALATLLLIKLISPFGIVELEEGGKITGFREKPELPHWINAGVYVFGRECIEMFPEVGDHETETFPGLVKEGKLFGYPATTFRTTINTVKDLNDANKELIKVLPDYLQPEPAS